METIKKKIDPTLEELERETEALVKKPQLLPKSSKPVVPPASIPPPPEVQRPPTRQPLTTMVTSEEKAKLTTKQVAKLPLFMKIDQYARIVKKLEILVDAFKEMDEILDKMEDIEKKELEEIQKWRDQLEITKHQVKDLLSEMPETGKIASVIRERKKEEIESKVKKEAEELKKEISGRKKEVEKAKAGIEEDIKILKDSITSLQKEIKSLSEEFRMISSLSKLKGAKTSTQKGAEPVYKKGKSKTPWE